MGWEAPLLARLVALANGETVPYEAGLVMGLDVEREEDTRNHQGMGIVGEATRALRAFVLDPSQANRKRWQRARRRLVAYLRDELTNGLWGNEPLACTNHCEYHLAVMAFARLVAVESRDAELLDLTAQHCRAHGRLCATIADPTGQCWSAGWRVRLAKPGKRQDPPTHDGLTVLWRMVCLHVLSERAWNTQAGKARDELLARMVTLRQRPAFYPAGEGWSDPLYVGLACARKLLGDGDDLGGMAHEQPGHVPMRHRVLVYRWKVGHQVVIPRGKFKTRTSGSVNPNVVATWLRCEYGKGKRGTSAVSFGLEYATDPPGVPGGAECIEWGPRP